VVIFIAAAIALLVGLLDYLFGLGVNRLIIGG
jgi:preprotein translocase subunit SecE